MDASGKFGKSEIDDFCYPVFREEDVCRLEIPMDDTLFVRFCKALRELKSDFDGVGCVPIGLDDVSKFPKLTRALLEHGYSAKDIRKIYGGNTLRVMRAVEQTARSF